MAENERERKLRMKDQERATLVEEIGRSALRIAEEAIRADERTKILSALESIPRIDPKTAKRIREVFQRSNQIQA